MRQFSLEEYLKNPKRKVVTRDGCDVRIICTDKKRHCDKSPKIIALIKRDDIEYVTEYHDDGRVYTDGLDRDCDLFFAPKKYEGWVTVHKLPNGLPCTSTNIYDTKEEAEKYGSSMIATSKIEWMED